jgi:hypothetical protein
MLVNVYFISKVKELYANIEFLLMNAEVFGEKCTGLCKLL